MSRFLLLAISLLLCGFRAAGQEEDPLITAIVLIQVEADAIPEAAQAIADIEGVREVFVDMYSNNNVLEDFRAQCNNQLDEDSQLPPIPTMGSLKLENVKQSLYAFA